jgi:DNA processing protein
MLPNELFYKLSLSQVPNIGPVAAKALVKHFGNATSVFKSKKGELQKIPGIGLQRATAIAEFTNFRVIEDEIKFIEKHNIEILFFDEEKYPQQLINCVDAPLVLFYKGNANLNNTKAISIVGSRKNSNYGKKLIAELLEGIAQYNPLIVSGLALGIDIIAHRTALQNKLATVACLAHGLDRIYPDSHKATAKEMIENGGLLSEYFSGTIPDKENFPTRNRIVAGMTQATIIVETDIKGGSMITANLADSYNKDVMAYPGDIFSTTSNGCNYLIKSHKAHMITEPKDLIELLNWEPITIKPKIQRSLFIELSPEEKIIYDLVAEKISIPTDLLRQLSQLTNAQIASATLSLEMQNIIVCKPGKVFELY